MDVPSALGAANLVADDANGVPDALIHNVRTGERQVLRGGTVPVAAAALADGLLSPDARYAALSFLEGTRTVWRLVEPNANRTSAGIPGTVVDAPRFSGDGAHFAVSRTPTTAVQSAAVEVYVTSAWLDGPLEAPAPRWVSAAPARVPALSASGNRVAFFQTTTSTSPSASNAVVVADYVQGVTLWSNLVRRATVSHPALSADGRYVVWTSPGSGSNALHQVWRADVDAGTVALVSVGPDGASQANGNSKSAVISADGRYIAFASLADNLVANDANGAKDVFLRDTQTGQTLLVSRTPAGVAGHGWSLEPFFSEDGRSLFFLSHAPDLAARDANQAVDLFKVEILSDTGPLLVIERNLTTGRVHLRWSGAPGQTYALEYADQLGTAWMRLPGEYTGEVVVEVDTSVATRRFHRLREL